MKTTIDLPDDLVRKLKLRAIHDGRKFKDIAAEFLRNGLTQPSGKTPPPRPVIGKDKKTGLPIILGGRAAPKNQELTPERVAEILIEQEAQWSQGH